MDPGLSEHGASQRFLPGWCCGLYHRDVRTAQGGHITYIASEALTRGAVIVEPTQRAQDDWCRVIRETAVVSTEFETSCTPVYYNNEGGGEGIRPHLGEPYGPGFYAFDELLAEWRAEGGLEGLELRS